MHLTSFSQWLEQATRPHYPYYHPIQVALFTSLAYISTAYLTTMPPVRSMALITLAYVISQLIAPLFIRLFEPCQDFSLTPLIGQILQLATSLILAKIICNIAGQSLSFKETRQIGMVFLISLYATRFTLLKFRQAIAEDYRS